MKIAYALAWHDRSAGVYFYIPTDPEARTWRGPFYSREAMSLKMARELIGYDETEITWLKHRPARLQPMP